MVRRTYRVGDRIIYRVTKYTTSPGHRAIHVKPAPHGDSYWYHVDKYWTVTMVSEDRRKIVARTRRGKTHLLDGDDPNLRPSRWWERLIYHRLFPALEPPSQPDPSRST